MRRRPPRRAHLVVVGSLSLAFVCVVGATRIFAQAGASQAGEGRAGTTALLRAARPEIVEISQGEFTMGSTDGDLDERAANLCAAELGAFNLLSTRLCIGLPPPGRRGSEPPLCSDRGTFDDERGAHRVRLRAFAIDRTEVTVARYAQCVRAGACGAGVVRPGAPQLGGDTQPAVGLSWDDAGAFCAWAGGRLPTEAEWERAARGRDGRPFPWGWYYDTRRANAGSLDLSHQTPGGPGAGCTNASDGFAFTAPVGSFPAGASPEGLLDAAGNAWEWVSDLWDAGASRYPQGTQARLNVRVDPRGPARGAEHVLRGGGYTHPAFTLRTTYRAHAPAGTRALSYGARCAYER